MSPTWPFVELVAANAALVWLFIVETPGELAGASVPGSRFDGISSATEMTALLHSLPSEQLEKGPGVIGSGDVDLQPFFFFFFV